MTTADIPLEYRENPVRDQDMASHAWNRWLRTGALFPPRQRRIYQELAIITGHKSILEAGCGIGWGTAILKEFDRPFLYKAREAVHRIVIGTDLQEINLDCARQLYPFCTFDLWDITAAPYPAKLYDVVVAVEVIEHVADAAQAIANLCLSAREEVWLSTPNRRSDEIDRHHPRNPYHVREYTPEEVLAMIPSGCQVSVHHWDGLRELPLDTQVTPLVYRIGI